MASSNARRVHPTHASVLRFWLVGCVVLFSTGCWKSGPSKITIKGTVSLDGEPVREGYVLFIPEDPVLGTAGAIVAAGAFTITTHKGPHRVEVRAEEPLPQSAKSRSSDDEDLVFVSIIPKRYNDESTLKFDVQSRNDVADFRLTSEK